MRVRARITEPAAGAVLPIGTHTIRGKAWSGTGPITNVDVSFTGEGDWHQATARTARPVRTSGRTGRSTGKPPDVGRHTLRARATDAAGNVQPDVPPWNRLGYWVIKLHFPYQWALSGSGSKRGAWCGRSDSEAWPA